MPQFDSTGQWLEGSVRKGDVLVFEFFFHILEEGFDENGNKIPEKTKKMTFMLLKRLGIIEKKNDARVQNCNFKWQFSPRDLSKAQSLIWGREIIEKCNLK